MNCPSPARLYSSQSEPTRSSLPFVTPVKPTLGPTIPRAQTKLYKWLSAPLTSSATGRFRRRKTTTSLRRPSSTSERNVRRRRRYKRRKLNGKRRRPSSCAREERLSSLRKQLLLARDDYTAAPSGSSSNTSPTRTQKRPDEMQRTVAAATGNDTRVERWRRDIILPDRTAHYILAPLAKRPPSRSSGTSHKHNMAATTLPKAVPAAANIAATSLERRVWRPGDGWTVLLCR